MDNKKLAKRLKKHDEEALNEIIVRFTPLVSTIAHNISAGRLSRSDIEEVTSDVFVTLWRNAGEIREDTLKNYICCIAKSRTKDRLRKEHSGNISDIDDIDDTDGADEFFIDENYEKKELYNCLREEIMKIGEPDREILIRYYYYYQSVSVIARSLNMNVQTVKSKLRRTRIKLKTALKDRGY